MGDHGTASLSDHPVSLLIVVSLPSSVPVVLATPGLLCRKHREQQRSLEEATSAVKAVTLDVRVFLLCHLSDFLNEHSVQKHSKNLSCRSFYAHCSLNIKKKINIYKYSHLKPSLYFCEEKRQT